MSDAASGAVPGADDRVFTELLARLGEQHPERRLAATRRAVELLGDVHRNAPVIHITGTNGKTSTARIVESLLRALGLRTGLFTSPHLVRVNERIAIDGAPIEMERLEEVWDDIQPVLQVVDRELGEQGQLPLTFFEALTVLGFAAFAEAPVDVVVLEVGMGGEWDSTNVADAQVAVFTPIALDHQKNLGDTLAAIARTKAGIIKPASRVVTATQPDEALVELRRAAELSEAPLAVEGSEFAVLENAVAVGGQSIEVQGLAGRYGDLLLPLFGDHQAHNAALAIAAVESFVGDGGQELDEEVLEAALADATSPGRLQLIGTAPTVLIDGAHNPAGAEALAAALGKYFSFEELAIVLSVVADKDARGMIAALTPQASRFLVTRSHSERALPVAELSEQLRDVTADFEGGAALQIDEFDALPAALADARAWAAQAEGRAVLVTGSLILVGEALAEAVRGGWYGRGQ